PRAHETPCRGPVPGTDRSFDRQAGDDHRIASCDRMDEIRAANLGRLLPGLSQLVLPNLPPGIRCLDGTNHCAYTDDAYRDSHRLKRAWSMKGMVRRTYLIGYASRHIHIHSRLRPTAVSPCRFPS